MDSIKQQYVTASLDLLKNGSEVEVVIDGLKKVMERRGHTKLFGAVLNLLNTKLAQIDELKTPHLTLAKQEDIKNHPDLANKAIVKINSNIIGGYILQEANVYTDQSYKTRLLNWYKSAIKS